MVGLGALQALQLLGCCFLVNVESQRIHLYVQIEPPEMPETPAPLQGGDPTETDRSRVWRQAQGLGGTRLSRCWRQDTPPAAP